jgi:S-adenosylmethionine synthetase
MIINGLFSSESVSEGHPDKLADRISDRILDTFLAHDPQARVACETLLADQCVVVAGEFKTRDLHDFQIIRDNAESLVREVLRDSGYRNAASGIDPQRCEVQIRFNHQSADISQGVDRADRILGAGDQGLMFGYACDETPELLPAPIVYAHRLVRRQAELRKSGELPWLQPDAKAQVTFRYLEGRPVGVEAVVLSTQHADGIELEELRAAVLQHIIDPVIPAELRTSLFRVLINPTGRFVIGGPQGDAGLTGRKIIVDTYGGAAPHGGGAFSGKDPSKVDRSAAYMARFLARQVVSRGWARRALVQIAYAIGEAEPVSFAVETFGTQTDTRRDIAGLLQAEFDLRPQAIIERLDLQRPIYYPTAAYGHFGRADLDLPWEQDVPCPGNDALQALAQARKAAAGGRGPSITTSNVLRDNTSYSFGMVRFLDDYAACARYLAERGLYPLCDNSIESCILQRLRSSTDNPDIASRRDVLERIEVVSMAEAALRVREDARCVWISTASSIGGLHCGRHIENLDFPQSQPLGLAGFSPFNGSYGGFSLWEISAGRLANRLVRF